MVISRCSVIHKAAFDGDLCTVRQWLDDNKRSSGVDLLSADDTTPLHYSCHQGHAQVAKFLLQEGDVKK
ncbi:unnamed protein product [Sphacelaria rigidula]